MTETKEKPTAVRTTIAFNKKSLRKTILTLFDNDIFQLTSKVLDRDTLTVDVMVSHYTIPSLQAVVGMYLKEFADATDDFVIEDWMPKSKLEG